MVAIHYCSEKSDVALRSFHFDGHIKYQNLKYSSSISVNGTAEETLCASPGISVHIRSDLCLSYYISGTALLPSLSDLKPMKVIFRLFSMDERDL